MPKLNDPNNNNTKASNEETSIVINAPVEDAPDETQPLLPRSEREPSGSRFFTAVNTTQAVIDSGIKMYGGFRFIALTYYQGYWLLAPMGLGMCISISENAFSHLKKAFPENKVVQMMDRIAKTGQEVIVETSKDFGFNLVLAHFISQQLTSKSYYHPHAAQMGTWISSGGLTAAMLVSRMCHGVRVFNVLSSALTSMHSIGLPLDVLQDQGIIDQNSMIPLYAASGLFVVGAIAGYVEKDYPRLALILKETIQTLCTNPSLATLLFALPNDLYAADHHDEVAESFFYPTAVIAILYLLLLTVSTAHDASCQWKALSKTEDAPTRESERDSMRELNEDDFQDWQASPDSQHDSDSEASSYTP